MQTLGQVRCNFALSRAQVPEGAIQATTMQGSYSAMLTLRRALSLLAGLQHFNARKWHKGLYDDQPRSLKLMVESLGLVWQGTYHRGYRRCEKCGLDRQGNIGLVTSRA